MSEEDVELDTTWPLKADSDDETSANDDNAQPFRIDVRRAFSDKAGLFDYVFQQWRQRPCSIGQLQNAFAGYLKKFDERASDYFKYFPIVVPSEDPPQGEQHPTMETVAAVMMSREMGRVLDSYARDYPGAVRKQMAEFSSLLDDIRKGKIKAEKPHQARHEDLFTAELLAWRMMDDPTEKNLKQLHDHAKKLSGHFNKLYVGIGIALMLVGLAFLIWGIVTVIPMLTAYAAGTAGFSIFAALKPVSGLMTIFSGAKMVIKQGLSHEVSGALSSFGNTVWKEKNKLDKEIDIKYGQASSFDVFTHKLKSSVSALKDFPKTIGQSH